MDVASVLAVEISEKKESPTVLKTSSELVTDGLRERYVSSISDLFFLIKKFSFIFRIAEKGKGFVKGPRSPSLGSHDRALCVSVYCTVRQDNLQSLHTHYTYRWVEPGSGVGQCTRH